MLREIERTPPVFFFLLSSFCVNIPALSFALFFLLYLFLPYLPFSLCPSFFRRSFCQVIHQRARTLLAQDVRESERIKLNQTAVTLLTEEMSPLLKNVSILRVTIVEAKDLKNADIMSLSGKMMVLKTCTGASVLEHGQ